MLSVSHVQKKSAATCQAMLLAQIACPSLCFWLRSMQPGHPPRDWLRHNVESHAPLLVPRWNSKTFAIRVLRTSTAWTSPRTAASTTLLLMVGRSRCPMCIFLLLQLRLSKTSGTILQMFIQVKFPRIFLFFIGLGKKSFVLSRRRLRSRCFPTSRKKLLFEPPQWYDSQDMGENSFVSSLFLVICLPAACAKRRSWSILSARKLI